MKFASLGKYTCGFSPDTIPVISTWVFTPPGGEDTLTYIPPRSHRSTSGSSMLVVMIWASTIEELESRLARQSPSRVNSVLHQPTPLGISQMVYIRCQTLSPKRNDAPCSSGALKMQVSLQCACLRFRFSGFVAPWKTSLGSCYSGTNGLKT